MKPELGSRMVSAAKVLPTPALATYAVSAAVAASSFLATLVLARLSGPEVIGHYALAMTTANLLAVLALMGLDRVLIREVAGDLREGTDQGRPRAMVRAVWQHVLLTSLGIGCIYLFLVLRTPLTDWVGGDLAAMAAATAGVFVWPMLRLGFAALRGIGQPFQGQLHEGLPTMLFGLAMLAVAAAGLAPSAWQATAFFVVMQAFAAFSAWFLIARTAGSWSRADATIDLDLRRVGLPIMGVIFIQTFSDLLLLAQISAHASPADAGAFRVAFQIVNIVNLVLVTSESYVAARVAGDFRTARPDLAWHRHRRATLFMLMATAPVLVLTLVAPEPLLRIVFGPEFAVAASALFVMAIGQTVNILRGPIGSMLSMSGHDGVPLRLNLVSFLLLVVLSVTLIPTMGLTGAGIAQAVPVVFRAIAAYVVARRLIPDRAVAA